MLLIQSLPLIVLVVLLATGRAGPVWSCAAALLLALPAAWLHTPANHDFGADLGASLIEGMWLAAIPLGIITGGLVFHEGASRAGVGPADIAPATGHIADHAFTAALLLGMFTEAATGFGVGTVFAIGALRKLGLAGAPAAAIGLLAQVGIPWGGLGPGTAIGAALAGIDAQDMSQRNAMILAPSLLLLLPLFWWWCGKLGLAVSKGTMLRQVGWTILLGSLLVGLHHLLPWQLCGMMASGSVLTLRLLITDPPRDLGHVIRLGRSALPYLVLASLLMASQAWHNAPSLHPFAALPALAANHAMVSIWLAALLMFVLDGKSPALAWAALRRARRPALALVGFVVLARILSNAGIPVALAQALVASLGGAAPFAAPLLSAMAGFFSGTNVGANSAMMPLQAALGQEAGLGSTVLPAVQNGTLALVISPQLTAIAAGLMGGGVTQAQLWRIMWPVAAIGLLAGTVSILIG